jgi:exodeoxyribonuclease V beta subunit
LNKTDKGLSLVRLNKESAAHSPELTNLYSDNRKKSIIDELNTAYVSLTRAKDELYVYIPSKSGTKKNLARVLIDADYEAGLVLKNEKSSAAKITILPETVYGDWIKILKDEFTGVIDIEKLEAASFGETVHFALSLLGNLTIADVEKEIVNAVSGMKARYPSMENINLAVERIRSAVASKHLEDIFFNGNDWVCNEQEILDKNGITKRVDRLVVGKDKVLIVDYKSSKENMESHKKQVLEYIELLKPVYPGKSVEGRLVYLDYMTQEKIV